MPSSGYAAITFVANEQPTTAKWNLIGSNDASFNTGAGFNDSIIINRHIADNSISLKKANADVAFYAYMSTAQNTINGAAKMGMQTELWDNGNNFDSTTNYRFVAPANGIYQFSGCCRIANGTGARCISILYKNGAAFATGNSQGADTFAGSTVSSDIKLAATDYVELWHVSNQVDAFDLTAPTSTLNFFTGHLIGEY
jgi:hypothetical protein